MVVVASRYVIEVDSERMPVAFADGEPIYREDPPHFFDIETYPNEWDDLHFKDTIK